MIASRRDYNTKEKFVKQILLRGGFDNERFLGYTSTVARTPAEQNKIMVQKYVDASLAGVEPREAARIAGYSDKTSLDQIIRPGGPVETAMCKALKERGIDEEFIAKEYAEGIKLSKSSDAAQADCNAHAKYLLQLGYLKGYGKSGPQVAVQINNNTNTGSDSAIADERIGETLQEVRELLAVVRAELSQREPTAVSGEDNSVAGGDIICPEVEAHPGVVPPSSDT